MFVDSRDQSRQFFFTVWEKLSRNEALSPLEFGAAATLTNPLRAEIMARFKSA